MTLARGPLLSLLLLAAAKVVAVAELTHRTRITHPPEDIEVAAGSNARFRCSATADPSLELTVEWLFNGEPLDFDGHTRLVRTVDNTLVVTNTTALDSGVYTCVANTSVDSDRAQASLIVQDVPNPPELLSVACETNNALLQWMPRGDNRAPILSYAVQYNTSFTPDTWEDAFVGIPATDTEFRLALSPWTNYTFRVVARNKVGPSAPSRPSSPMCSTPEDVPYKNPDNVVGSGDRPDNLVISWTPMPLIDHNAPGFFYKVLWKRLGAPDHTWSSHIVDDWTQNKLVLYDQPTFTPYRIRVEAHNRRGQANTFPAEVVGYSGEDVPLAEPKEFRLVQLLGPRSAQLSWSPVSTESLRGQFRGYKIQTWTSEEGEQLLREVLVPANATTAEVNVFRPFLQNFVRILAFNDKYNGPPSDSLVFFTPEGTPGPVDALEAMPTGSTGFYLTWKHPLQPNGALTGYHIYFQEVRGTELEPEMQRLPPVRDPLQTKARLAGLKPNTLYRITVRAATALGLGDRYFIERRTGEHSERMPDAPDFTWAQIPDSGGNASIKVTWVPSKSGHPGSDFYVQYRPKGNEAWQRTGVETHYESVLLTGLEAGVLYELRVVSVDGALESASRIQEIQTGGLR